MLFHGQHRALIPFLGSRGNFIALLVGIVCLIVSVLIYAPFVIASSKAELKEDEARKQIN